MDILTIHTKYNTQRKCLKLLEKIRWGKNVKCTYCGSEKNKPAKGEPGRYSCRKCKRTFSVLVDTIFEDTRLPLPKWFVLIGMMLNSKSGVSAKELQRNLKLTYKTAYYCAMRVRVGMLMPDTQLRGILEMDESYFGGDPRKTNSGSNKATLSKVTLKRGRGTKKISVVGVLERDGNVRTKVVEKLTKRNLLHVLKQFSKDDGSLLITDGFRSYQKLNEYIEHLTINHSKQFSKGILHINSIEGFWSYVKNGIRGNYKSISPKYLPFYLVMYEWQYNHRNYRGNIFEKYLKNALSTDKELEHWKAEDAKQVKEIAYG